jgi:hypothetical protein
MILADISPARAAPATVYGVLADAARSRSARYLATEGLRDRDRVHPALLRLANGSAERFAQRLGVAAVVGRSRTSP